MTLTGDDPGGGGVTNAGEDAIDHRGWDSPDSAAGGVGLQDRAARHEAPPRFGTPGSPSLPWQGTVQEERNRRQD